MNSNMKSNKNIWHEIIHISSLSTIILTVFELYHQICCSSANNRHSMQNNLLALYIEYLMVLFQMSYVTVVLAIIFIIIDNWSPLLAPTNDIGCYIFLLTAWGPPLFAHQLYWLLYSLPFGLQSIVRPPMILVVIFTSFLRGVHC